MTALAKSSGRLAACEKVIEDGLRTFVEVGRALAEIRDSELYKKEHATFEAYCKAKWDFTRAHAYRLIEGAGVVANVSNWRQEKLPSPSNEAQARELARLPEKQQPKAWADAVKTAPDGVVTAKHVASVVAGYLPPAAPKPVEPKSETRPVAATPAAPAKWECPECRTWWPAEVDVCRECEAIEEGDDPAGETFDPLACADDLLVSIIDAFLKWPASESFRPVIEILEQQLSYAREREDRDAGPPEDGFNGDLVSMDVDSFVSEKLRAWPATESLELLASTLSRLHERVENMRSVESKDAEPHEFVGFVQAHKIDRFVRDMIARWPVSESLVDVTRALKSSLHAVEQAEKGRLARGEETA